MKGFNLLVVEAAKRRSLPAWIRDGLEKMDQEKQKEEDKKIKAKMVQEAKDRAKEENSDLPNKSKFVRIRFIMEWIIFTFILNSV